MASASLPDPGGPGGIRCRCHSRFHSPRMCGSRPATAGSKRRLPALNTGGERRPIESRGTADGPLATHFESEGGLNVRYAPVGQCIYCGILDVPQGMKRFHDEHIVPLALNGALILPEASCRQCERIINMQIENRLAEEYAYFRTKYGLPTRRPKNRKKTVKLRSITGGWIDVPATEYTAPVPLYRFKMARILSGAPPISNSHAWTMDILGGGDKEVRLQKNIPFGPKRTFLKRSHISLRASSPRWPTVTPWQSWASTASSRWRTTSYSAVPIISSGSSAASFASCPPPDGPAAGNIISR